MSTALHLDALHKSFGRTEIIRGVDLSVPKGERHAIIGPNGAGKSTLFNLITGRYPVSSGEVHMHGENVTGTLSIEHPFLDRQEEPDAEDPSDRSAARCLLTDRHQLR